MLITLLLFYILSASAITFDCATKNCKVRIIGGHDADIKDHPHQARVLIGGTSSCGGSIIDSQHVITAAHCTNGKKAHDLHVQVGSHFKRKGHTIAVKKLHQHPHYNVFYHDNDISILTIDEVLEFDETIQAISLPIENEEPKIGTVCNITGWGRTEPDGFGADRLQVANVTILEREKCIQAYPHHRINDLMLCAGVWDGGRDSCKGDSGGPFVCNKVLYGVVSWGQGCGKPKKPGVYTNVVKLISFIKETIEGEKSQNTLNTI